MPTYPYLCPTCATTIDLIVPISARDDASCPTCSGRLQRQVCAPAVRPDPFSWSNENKGRGRYISQLQRTLGKKRDKNAYCKNRDEIVSKAEKLGCGVDKSVY